MLILERQKKPIHLLLNILLNFILGGTMYEFGKKLGEGAYGYVITARLESNPKVTYACKVILINIKCIISYFYYQNIIVIV